MRALITGASGLVGSYVAERMLADGWSVRALVREPSRAAWLGRSSIELRAGDILSRDSFVSAAEACDVIVHSAAAVVVRGGWEAYRVPNLEGTRNAIAAAEDAGARLVQVSSVAVYGPEARYAAGDGKCTEDTPLLPLPERAHYARSKRESEAMVLEAHAARRIWATAVRPDVIYGVRDRQFVPRVAKALRFGFAPLVNGGTSTLAIVHAANVADGIVRAARLDAAGGRAYNLANDFAVTMAEFIRMAGEGLGRRIRAMRVPFPVARAVARVASTFAALALGRSAGVMARSALDFVARDNPFSSDRARRELGWNPRVRPEVGIPEAFRWVRDSTTRDRTQAAA